MGVDGRQQKETDYLSEYYLLDMTDKGQATLNRSREFHPRSDMTSN